MCLMLLHESRHMHIYNKHRKNQTFAHELKDHTRYFTLPLSYDCILRLSIRSPKSFQSLYSFTEALPYMVLFPVSRFIILHLTMLKHIFPSKLHFLGNSNSLFSSAMHNPWVVQYFSCKVKWWTLPKEVWVLSWLWNPTKNFFLEWFSNNSSDPLALSHLASSQTWMQNATFLIKLW